MGRTYDEIYGSFTWGKFLKEHYEGNPEGRFNITHECVTRHARDPKKVAFFVVRRDWSYDKYTFRELEWLTGKFANVLKGLGVRKGDRVACLMSRKPETFITFLGALRVAAVYVPLFTAFGPEAIRYRLTDSGAVVIVTDVENRPKLEKLGEDLQGISVVTMCREGEANPYKGDLDFWKEVGNASTKCEIAETAGSDLAVIQYTSGTTGLPKGCMILHRGLCTLGPHTKYCLDIRDQDMFWSFAC